MSYHSRSSTLSSIDIHDRPELCKSCPYGSTGVGFVPTWAPPRPKVAFLAEAAGSTEIGDKQPLTGGTGRFFMWLVEQLGFTRADILIANVLSCFASYKTSIYTANGYKQWREIVVGDYVLSHTGRMCRVVSKVKIPAQKFLRISFNRPYTIEDQVVTPDHRFLTAVGWQEAQHLKAFDEVVCSAETCLACGKVYVRHFRHFRKSLSFCSAVCKNRVVKSSFEVHSASMKSQYADGSRDRYSQTAAANEENRRLVSIGENAFQKMSYEQRLATRPAAAKARENYIGSGFGEAEVAALLVTRGVDFTSQYAINTFNYDFRVGNFLVEVDGPGTESRNAVITARNEEKRLLGEEKGFKVVHISYRTPEAVLNVVDNDEHCYQFGKMQVSSVEEYSNRYRQFAYCLEVEDDHSFVAQGVVSHNCMPPSLKYPIGQLRKDAEAYCRRYDSVQGIGLEPGGLAAFDADCFIISIHPSAVLRSNQMTPLLQHKVADDFGGTLAKAFRLYKAGRRPLVLLGDKAKDLVAPEFAEGVTKWVGHIEDLMPGELQRRLAAVSLRDNISAWARAIRPPV